MFLFDLIMPDTEHFRFCEINAEHDDYDDYLHGRYEVFCEELHRVDHNGMQADSLGQAFEHSHVAIETDKFDSVSHHFIAYRKTTNDIASMVRVIMPNETLGLNVESRYAIERTPEAFPAFDWSKTCEISRMAVSQHFRRRRSDIGKPVSGDPLPEVPLEGVPSLGNNASQGEDSKRRHDPNLVLGMYREIYHLCVRNGVEYAVAAMDKQFSRILTAIGFPFKAISPINPNVSPPRCVFAIEVASLATAFRSRKPALHEFLHQELTAEDYANSPRHPGYIAPDSNFH